MSNSPSRMGSTMSMNDLMVALADNIRHLQDGTATPAQANAVAGSASVIFRGVKLQLDYARLVNRAPKIELLEGGDNN